MSSASPKLPGSVMADSQRPSKQPKKFNRG